MANFNGNGGSRSGAGRPKGSKNTRTKMQVEAAKATGLLPAEILLSIARGESLAFGRPPTPDELLKAATAAAPYYNARLNAVEHSGGITSEGFTQEEIAALLSDTEDEPTTESPAPTAPEQIWQEGFAASKN